jgi:hypothetical protein
MNGKDVFPILRGIFPISMMVLPCFICNRSRNSHQNNDKSPISIHEMQNQQEGDM